MPHLKYLYSKVNFPFPGQLGYKNEGNSKYRYPKILTSIDKPSNTT